MVSIWGFPIPTIKVLICKGCKRKTSILESTHLAGALEGEGE